MLPIASSSDGNRRAFDIVQKIGLYPCWWTCFQ